MRNLLRSPPSLVIFLLFVNTANQPSHILYMYVKLSVVVPVYNVSPFLHRCLESLLRQSVADSEVILVDDG